MVYKSAYNKKYREKNREKLLKYFNEWREKNKIKLENEKDKRKEYSKLWYEKNKERLKTIRKNYYNKTKEETRARKAQYMTNYRRVYPEKRLAHCLRVRINQTLKGKTKVGSLEEVTGLNTLNLKAYLESKFKPGMSWENYTYHGWHIDHIRPCASFDLSDPEQQKQCFHYTNLQPLWRTENLSKNKY